MRLDLFQVDAFTDRAFAGNPAAVCFCPETPAEGWMQQVAREMNLSETAFLLPRSDGWGLRWFTPAVEVALCGHATLASAHVLWETARLAADQPARFHTSSGLLTAERRGSWIEMDFPATPVTEVASPPPDLSKALGVAPRFVGKSRFDYLLEVASPAEVTGARPDFAMLAALQVRGVMLTARADGKPYDFISRFFAPGSGVAEDPVTGSAHCSLGPFWGERLGKEELLAFQASARGGTVRVRLAGDRVTLIGQAVTVLQGSLLAA